MRNFLMLMWLLLACESASAQVSSEACSTSSIQEMRDSAELGNSGAQYDLGSHYADGLCVKQDDKEAAKWYLKSAERGYSAAFIRLADIYSQGKGLQQDYAEAFFWLSLAAEANDNSVDWVVEKRDTAADELSSQQISQQKKRIDGWPLKMRQTTESDINKLYEMAKAGNPLAQYELGSNPGAIIKNITDFGWIKHAAMRGVKKAQLSYAENLSSQSSKPDDAEVFFWFALSCGIEKTKFETRCTEIRDYRAAHMDAKKLAETKRRVVEWKPIGGPVEEELPPMELEPFVQPRAFTNPIMELRRNILKPIVRGLREAIENKRIKPDEYEKLDFALPSAASFGSNLEYEIFNPKSPRSIVKKRQIRFEQSVFDNVSSVKGVQPIFNLRRKEERGTTMDTLWLIIPDVDRKLCETTYPPHPFFLPESVNKWKKQVEIANDNHKVMTDVSDRQTNTAWDFKPCNENLDGKTYLFLDIFGRRMDPGDTQWQDPTDMSRWRQ